MEEDFFGPKNKPLVRSWLLILFLIILVLGGVYYFWQKGDLNIKSEKTAPATIVNDAFDDKTEVKDLTKSSTKNKVKKTESVAGLFNETDFGFTFNYPENWTVESKVINEPEPGTGSTLKTKEVKIKTDSGNILTIDNPIRPTGFEGLSVISTKALIGTSGLIFNQQYLGPDGLGIGQYLYLVLTDQKLSDKVEKTVMFSLISDKALDQDFLTKLDNIVTSFKFVN